MTRNSAEPLRRSRETRSRHERPSDVFNRLPSEVCDCIVTHLRQLHRSSHVHHLRDLCNLSLTSRAWRQAAIAPMYRKAHILTDTEHKRSPRLKVKGVSRLKLLRRTLRESPRLAMVVRELELSDVQAMYADAGIAKGEIVNQVASLVIACPNLERVIGFYVPYMHTFDRFSYALATRTHLKERSWLLSEEQDHSSADEDNDSDPDCNYYIRSQDPTERFLEFNANHKHLTAFSIQQEKSHKATHMSFRAIIGTLRQFPLLQNLSLSGLSSSSFTNMTLNALPPGLQTLRLESLAGINDKGLFRFAASHLSESLRHLSLKDLEIRNVSTIAAFLSPHLGSLEHLTLNQYHAPVLADLDSASTDIVELTSTSLKSLNWQIRSQSPVQILSSTYVQPHTRTSTHLYLSEPSPCFATSLLARCIKQGKFPALRRVRVPHDPQGVIQSVCKPMASALLPEDAPFVHSRRKNDRKHDACQHRIETTTTKSLDMIPGSRKAVYTKHRTDSATSSPTSTSVDVGSASSHRSRMHALDVTNSTLVGLHSRLLAQSRIEGVRRQRQTFIAFRVFDPEGKIIVDVAFYCFLGDLRSKISYEVDFEDGDRNWNGR
ncbi:hypothetical protein M011DRAFT_406986 [Sporormia fimetaria CBS 119925]|uniref:F-box domain-containing protein n=1 Tax=Sporormia fimetaria CBS 119925 TaxID=1340428 RepID=A0A6A6V661_9PLEO|nr:hypothetical protein M011DRAFT_406986 [Sporormia fimetaria CBS 119925]